MNILTDLWDWDYRRGCWVNRSAERREAVRRESLKSLTTYELPIFMEPSTVVTPAFVLKEVTHVE